MEVPLYRVPRGALPATPGPQELLEQLHDGFRIVRHKYTMLVLLAWIAPSVALPEDAIHLNMSDVYFNWRPMPKGSAMCGYAIFGNHQSRDDPKIEWDMNIDEIVQGEVRVAAVSAGTFVVNGKKRTPRAPITEISFSLENDSEAILAQLVGAPNRDGGVRGTFDLEQAKKLFDALSNEGKIAAAFKYADGTSDLLKFAGYRDLRKFGRERNSPFEECLRGRTPRFNSQGAHPIQ